MKSAATSTRPRRALPSPSGVLLDLAAWKIGMLLLGAIVVVAIEQLTFPAPRSLARAVILPFAMAAIMGLAHAVALVRPWRFARELHGHIVASANRLAGPGVSGEAVRAFHELPRRAAGMAALSLLVLVASDLVGEGWLTGTGGLEGAAYGLLVFGVLQSAASVVSIFWRAALWQWLRYISPNHFPTDAIRRQLAQRFTLRVGSVLVLLACISLSLPLAFVGHATRDAPPEGVHLFFLGALLSTAAAVAGGTWLALRLGRRLADDVTELGGFVRSLSRAVRGQRARPGAVPPLRTRLAADLGARIVELSAQYGELLEGEVEARTNIETTQLLKRRFMAHMSHDLRSPLNSIAGFTEILGADDSPLNSEQRRSVVAIRRAGQDLVQLVTEIVDMARIEAGRLELVPEPTDLVAVLGDALEAVRRRSAEPVRIALTIDDSLPTLHLDPQRTAQAISGVLSHVTRLTPEGLITLGAGRLPDAAAGPHVLVEIVARDLPPEDTQRMFLAFREVRKASGRRVGGLGLGIALARSLVIAQGGDLAYDSEGGRFRFLFPVLAAETQDAETQAETPDAETPDAATPDAATVR